MATEGTGLLRESADVSDGAHQLSVESWVIVVAVVVVFVVAESSAKDDVPFQLAR